MIKWVLAFLFLNFSFGVMAQKKSTDFEDLLFKNASDSLKQILQQPHKYKYQIIYTQIDRDKNNKPQFKNHYLNVDANQYFYPASMAKLPIALLALEKVNKIGKKVNMFTPMVSDTVQADASAQNGLPSIAHYIKKIFLVSDNDAYNQLFNFVGQQNINEALWKKGYKDVQITRQFFKLTDEQNRMSSVIQFKKGNQVLYQQPAMKSTLQFDFSKKLFIGKQYIDDQEKLINAPKEFTTSNIISLETLQLMMQAVLFPKSVAKKYRFNLTKEQYQFLYQYMSEWASESSFPKYDSNEFFDSYTKFFFFRADGKKQPPHYIRSFNKTGWSYGCLTDVCYIIDTKNKLEFMLSGTIYANEDEILNDDKYDYERIGYPFFKEVGKIVYEHELKRSRKFQPNFKKWEIKYD